MIIQRERQADIRHTERNTYRDRQRHMQGHGEKENCIPGSDSGGHPAREKERKREGQVQVPTTPYSRSYSI